MKLKRILHPEVALGVKGHPTMRWIYEMVRKEFKIHPDTYSYGETISRLCQTTAGTDLNAISHLAIIRKFQQESPKVYYVGRDFALALQKIDKEIPMEFFPEKFFGYIAFPKNTVRDEDEFVEGAYIYIGYGRDAGGCRPEHQGMRFLWISYVSQPSDDGLYRSNTKFLAPLRTGKLENMAEGLDSVDYLLGGDSEVSSEVERKRMAVYRLAVNTVLYIHSQNSEIQLLKPERLLTKSQKKATKAGGGGVTDCHLPVVLVNWNYHTGMEFTKDSTTVDSFLRWQRCGVGLTQYKLVWVREHIRRYKNANSAELRSGAGLDNTSVDVSQSR